MSRRYKGGVISATAPTTSGTPNTGVATGVWTMQQQMQAQGAGTWPNVVVQGQQAYTTAGTYSWTAPAGVTSVSVVCVGSGGNVGQGAGALAYKNNIAVTPGASYTVVVNVAPGTSYFSSVGTVSAGQGATRTGDGGGDGGGGYGGGAGGYSGNGGNGSYGVGDGSGGGGGGGGGAAAYAVLNDFVSGGGGGVGILGEGASGAGGTGYSTIGSTTKAGKGGSGGANGASGASLSATPNGGSYGGGAGLGSASGFGIGGGGAVRIIWPGTTRQFPSTNTGDM